jgi:PilZ domain
MAAKPETRMPSAAPSDQRGAPRLTLLLRAGKLVSARGEFLCVLRDASASGLKARIFHELPHGCYELEVSSGQRYPIEQVWQEQGHAGFRFTEGPIDIAGLVDEAGPLPKRQIRLMLNPPLGLRLGLGEEIRPGQLHDISLHGARIEAEPGLALGQLVRIEGQGLPPLHGRVRWRRGKVHGLVFHQGFQLEQLAQLAARLQLGRPASAKIAPLKA